MRALTLSALFAALATTAVAAPDTPLSGTLVDVVEDAAPVRDVLRRLEAKHGLNYVVTEETLTAAGTVTVHLRQVPLDDALEAICAACNLNLQIRGRILIMLPREKPLLPRVEEGLLPEGSKRSRPLDPPADPPPAKLPTPDRPPAPPRVDDASSMTVGTVLEVDMKNGRLRIDADGLKRDLYLPNAEEAEGRELQAGKLRRALTRLRKGDRVALLYRRTGDGARPLLTDLIGGQAVRNPVTIAEAQAARTGRRRPRRTPREQPPRKARNPPAKKPQPAAPAKAKPPAPHVPEGVLAGRFVGREGDVVKIRRADGEVIECQLPAEGAEREKVVAVIDELPEGAKVFMTFQRTKDGKTVLKGGLSEVR
jgi:hypothetical protein